MIRRSKAGRGAAVLAALGMLGVLGLTGAGGAILHGCGANGAGAGSSPAPTTQTGGGVRFVVRWPRLAGSRAIPKASRALKFTIYGGEPEYDKKVSEKLVVRPSGDTPTSEVVFDKMPVDVNLRVHVLAFPDGEGSGVAQAVGATVVTTGGSGSEVGSEVTLGTTVVRLVAEPSNPSVREGAALPVTVTAYDAEDRIVLTAPESWSWESADEGVAKAAAQGNPAVVSGVKAGATTVKGTLEGTADPADPASEGLSISFPVTVTAGSGCVPNYGQWCGQNIPEDQDTKFWRVDCDGACLFLPPK